MTEPDEREPTRLSSAASDADPALRAALAAGRAEVPSEAQLSALAAKLGPLAIPAASGATLGAWPVVAGLVAVIAVVAAVAVVALNGASPGHVGTVASADGAAADAAAADAAADAAAADAADAADAAAAVDAAAAAATDADAAPRPFRPHAVLAAAPPDAPLPLAADLEAELALLRAAQDALRTDAARALSLADEHARRFADGTLAQEREVVAIEALAALSRSAEARARAERFTARWPRSAHARRLAVVLGDAGL